MTRSHKNTQQQKHEESHGRIHLRKREADTQTNPHMHRMGQSSTWHTLRTPALAQSAHHVPHSHPD